VEGRARIFSVNGKVPVDVASFQLEPMIVIDRGDDEIHMLIFTASPSDSGRD
jgi:hypothetical protein